MLLLALTSMTSVATAAAVTCTTVTGYGDAQAELFSVFNAKPGPWENYCTHEVSISYASGSSQLALEEFGMQEHKLKPNENGWSHFYKGEHLDGYVGTEDPPDAENLTESRVSSRGSYPGSTGVCPVVSEE